jgi:small-conductance mechanosensitive channel
VPTQPSPLAVLSPTPRQWLLGISTGVVALAALVVGSAWGQVHARAIDPRIIGWACAAALALFGALATTLVSSCLGRLVTRRSLPSAGGALRIIAAGAGYVVVLFGVLAVLDVSVEKLLVGAGLAGVVLGIAATQSLGNVFAGLVIILARPFAVGNHIRIRSGALGGVLDGWVMEMSLTYTTLRLDDGPWKIPNGVLLAAGVGQLPRTTAVPPLPQVPGAPLPGGVAAPPPSSLRSTDQMGDPSDRPNTTEGSQFENTRRRAAGRP